MSRKPSKRNRHKNRKQSGNLSEPQANIPAENHDDLQVLGLQPEKYDDLQGTALQLHLHPPKKQFKGPLPSPETFAKYREIKPDLPEIIISEWQKEGDARREYARSFGNREWGRIAIVGIFALGMLALSGWLAYKEQYECAVTVLISPFAVKLIAALRGSK